MARQLPDAATAAQEWVKGASQSGDKITRGINRVSEAPGAKAARKKDKYRQGVNDNIEKWAGNTAAVTLEQWRADALKGVPRVAEGARNKEGKYAGAIGPVLAHMQGVLNTVDAMDDSNLEARIAKSGAFQRGMARYRRSGGA